MELKAELQNRIQKSVPQDLSQNFRDYACVSMLLRGSSKENLELAYILRAENPHDRWSGQIAFPGGRREPSDANDIHTATRETLEEIGVSLKSEQLLGKLHDVQAKKGGKLLEFYIRPFVFYIPEKVDLRLDPKEVADFFWQPLSYLRDPQNHKEHEILWNEKKVLLPAIDFNRPTKLWGLTYLMTKNLIEILF